VQILVLPRALAKVEVVVASSGSGDNGIDSLTRCCPDELAKILFLHEDCLVGLEHSHLEPNLFGGCVRGKIEEFKNGRPRVVDVLALSWLSRPHSSTPSAAFIQTMANNHCPKDTRKKRSAQLIEQQKESFVSSVGVRVPHAIAIFACSGRGQAWYDEPTVEAQLVCDAYVADHERQRSPAIFGMFCGGEWGPLPVGHRDVSDDSSDFEDPEIEDGREDAAVHVEVARYEPGAAGANATQSASASSASGSGSHKTPAGNCAAQEARRSLGFSGLQGFTTIIGLLN